MTEFILLGSTPFKDGTTLAPKLADLLSSWKSGSTPIYTGSGILDLDRLTFCTIETCQLDEIHYLETRSRHVNKSFIIFANLDVFYSLFVLVCLIGLSFMKEIIKNEQI